MLTLTKVFVDESLMYFWNNFDRPAPRRPTNISFLYNGSHCGSLESQSLWDGFVTFSSVLDGGFISHLFFFFFFYQDIICVVSWDILAYLILSDRCHYLSLILQVRS